MSEPMKNEPVKNAKKDEPARPAVQLWNVLIRHSPFPLKQAMIEANSPEEAKRVFLKLAEQKHQTILKGIRGPASEQFGGKDRSEKEKREISASWQAAIAADRRGEVEWIIRPQEEVDRERAENEGRRERDRREFDDWQRQRRREAISS